MSVAEHPAGTDHAMDWRFFLPISAGKRILMIGSDCHQDVHFFKKLGVSSVDSMINPSVMLEAGMVTSTFDMILAPQGLLLDNDSGGQLFLYRKLIDLLVPHGTFFMGFSNTWRSGDNSAAKGHSSSIKGMRRTLRSAGFEEMQFLGLMGQLDTPDYILPLKRETVGFVLHHKYRHKVPSRFGHLFFNPWITVVFSHFFGAYFVTAVAPGKSGRRSV